MSFICVLRALSIWVKNNTEVIIRHLHINFKSPLVLVHFFMALPQWSGRDAAVPRLTPSLQTFSKVLGHLWDAAKPRLTYVTKLVTWNPLGMSHPTH